LQKYEICLIFLNFCALLLERLNPENLRTYFCANPKVPRETGQEQNPVKIFAFLGLEKTCRFMDGRY